MDWTAKELNHTSVPSGGKRFCLLQSIQTMSVAHPSSYSFASRGIFLQVWSSHRHKADHSPLSSGKAENGWN